MKLKLFSKMVTDPAEKERLRREASMRAKKAWNAKRKDHPPQKAITRDIIQVKPFTLNQVEINKPKNEAGNSGVGFLAALGYKVDGAVRATYKSPLKA